ncbi:MAG: hypothetical protein ACOCWM_05705, partial [Cyclobacteriaceae bacterium]
MAVINKKSTKQRTRKLFLLGGVLVFIIALAISENLLYFSKPIPSDNYLIEGWVSPFTLEQFALGYNGETVYLPGKKFEIHNNNPKNYHKSKRKYIALIGNSMLNIDPNT